MMVDLAPDAIDDAFWRHHQGERAGCRNRQFRAPASQSQIEIHLDTSSIGAIVMGRQLDVE
jgi:hypothetical protein